MSTQVVVVTGAAGRLGSRMVEGFGNSGYTVVGIGHGLTYDVDLTDEKQVADTFATIAQKHDPIYALVHTVGMWNMEPIAEMSLSSWDTMMKVNLTSTFLCFREAARHMINGEGRLVAISSVQGTDRAHRAHAHYAASKAGVVRLVEAAASEYSGQGITAHALAPDTITFYDTEESGVPAEDIVQSVLYLCSPAGRSANGVSLRMFGPRGAR